MMTPEARVKAAIVVYLKHRVPDVWFWCVQDRFTSGVMDIVGVYKGHFFAIEVKRPGGRARRLQKYIMDKVIRAGGHVVVADNLAVVEDLFRRLDGTQ